MDEMLKYAVENGIIDLSHIQEKIEMNKRKEYLEKQSYKIWLGKDAKWRTYIPDEKKGRRMIKRGSRKEIEDIVIEYWKSQEENPTITEVFQEWNDRRLALNKISASTHLRNKQVFNRHYEKFGKRKIKSIIQEDVEEFLEEQIPEHQLSSKAFSNLKTVTRGFLKRAKKRKLINFNVEEIFNEIDVSEIDFTKRIKEDYEEVFDEIEMSKMMNYLINNLDVKNICILLMFLTGIRVGEAVALKHEDFYGNTVNIRRTETRYKNAENRYIYEIKDFPKSEAGVRTVIIPSAYSWICNKIKMINPFGEYVFYENGKRYNTQVIRRRLRRLCKMLNIYHKSPHKIRKTYGTILLDNNVDNYLIIGQMGHTDIACTETHYHRNRRSIEQKSEIISSIPEFSLK